MKSSSILVNYCGYPNSMNNLILDNGMATLAGSLIEAGHDVLVMDFLTVDTIRDFYPLEYHHELTSLIGTITSSLNRHEAPPLQDIERLHEIEAKVETFQEKKLSQITKMIVHNIESRHCDFVGFKLWTGEGFVGSVKMAQALRAQFPDLKIFAGGPHNDYFKEMTYGMTDAFDALVYGEGEMIIPQLAEVALGKADLSRVPNVIIKRNGKVRINPEVWIDDLNRLPRPVYDPEVYPAVKGDKKVKIVCVDESRGCPKRCNFCMHGKKSGDMWRVKGATRIVDEIERMRDHYGFHVFRFAGSNTPSRLQQDVAQELIARKTDITYGSFSSAGYISDYTEMKRAGCFGLFFGIESGSETILTTMINKQTTRNQIIQSLKKSKEAGLYTVGSVIVPAPGETEQTRQETISLLLEARPNSILLNMPGLIRGTEWADNYHKYGFELSDPETFHQTMMRYRVKSTYPPELWNPLPYKVDGKDFRQMVKEAGDFVRIVSSNGIPVGISDELALISSCTGLTPEEFYRKIIADFSSARFGEIENLVRTANRSALRAA